MDIQPRVTRGEPAGPAPMPTGYTETYAGQRAFWCKRCGALVHPERTKQHDETLHPTSR